MTPAPATLAANKAPNDILAELRFAESISEPPANVIKLFLPDRDGDPTSRSLQRPIPAPMSTTFVAAPRLFPGKRAPPHG